jgi:hypothetical protein
MRRGVPMIVSLPSPAHENSRGHEFVPALGRISECGRARCRALVGRRRRDRAHEEIMIWAIGAEAVVLPHDLDFRAIVVAAIHQTQTELMAGAIVSVDPVHARLRLLALQP